VIELYHEHGTSEQFHAEIKSELDLERLPSGKFATHALMLALGLVAYNVLTLCGQAALDEDRRLPPEQKLPLAKPVFRRRLRSVIQDLMYLATRLTRHARRCCLSLRRSNRGVLSGNACINASPIPQLQFNPTLHNIRDRYVTGSGRLLSRIASEH
jgi:hypothetical protein